MSFQTKSKDDVSDKIHRPLYDIFLWISIIRYARLFIKKELNHNSSCFHPYSMFLFNTSPAGWNRNYVSLASLNCFGALKWTEVASATWRAAKAMTVLYLTERRLDEGNYGNCIYLIKFSVQTLGSKTSDLPEAKFKRNITNSGSTRSFICSPQCFFLIDLKKRDYFESASANLEIDHLKASSNRRKQKHSWPGERVEYIKNQL